MASSPPPTAPATTPELVGASTATTERQAQLSLILGVVSCIPAVGVICCVPAIICGHIGWSRARRAAQPVDIRVVVGLMLGYVIALIYAWMAIGLFVVPALSNR